jgi:hypothetical protein
MSRGRFVFDEEHAHRKKFYVRRQFICGSSSEHYT